MKSIGVFLILALSATTNAFTLNSATNPNLKGWAGADVQLMINTANCPSGIDVVGIVSEAAEVWNNVPTSKIKVSYGGSTTGTSMSSPTTVYCETNFQALLGANQDAVPGAASVDGSTGEISRGVLYLNASSGLANIANYDRTVLKIILAHEIGHILGLGHSASTSALMYYDATARKELSLSQDDMDGMSYLYPSDELSDKKIAGCGRTNSSSGSSPWNMLFLMVPLLLALGLRKDFPGLKNELSS